jgi:hypothetical protein
MHDNGSYRAFPGEVATRRDIVHRMCKRLGRPTISAATNAAIRKALIKGGIGIRKIATTLGVGTGTVQRIKAEMSA